MRHSRIARLSMRFRGPQALDDNLQDRGGCQGPPKSLKIAQDSECCGLDCGLKIYRDSGITIQRSTSKFTSTKSRLFRPSETVSVNTSAFLGTNPTCGILNQHEHFSKTVHREPSRRVSKQRHLRRPLTARARIFNLTGPWGFIVESNVVCRRRRCSSVKSER